MQFSEAVLRTDKPMLTKELDRETEQLLAEILERENTTSDELIRNLIRDRWLSLNKQAVELPINLPEPVSPTLEMTQAESRQKNSKQTIAEFIRRKRYR